MKKEEITEAVGTIGNELWEETNFAETFEKAPMEWDGHTSEDVLERISKL